MDSLETSSNFSDQSDHAESIISSLSGLSGYEDELLEIKSLITTKPGGFIKHVTETNNNKSVDAYHYEIKIKNLTADLENALKLNEKLKSEIIDRRCKHELDYHNKFEKLISTNSKLQSQLNSANAHIKDLQNKTLKNNSYKVSNHSEENDRNLEQVNFELTSKINLLENELEHWKNNANENENINKRLKIELEEIKYTLDIKNNTVAALKRTISDLHLQNQNALQNNITIGNALAIKENEIEALRNSEIWYKEQLYLCQQEKKKIFEDNIKLNSDLLSKDHEIKNINLQLSNYKNRNQELISIHNKEKQELIGKLQDLENTKSNNVQIHECIKQQNSVSTLQHYENVIKDLKLEIDSVKEEVAIQQSHFESIKKQNSDLTSLNMVIQKKLNEKESYIETLLFQIKDLQMNLESSKKQNDAKRGLINDLTEKSIEMQAALTVLAREKEETESVVTAVRENFNKLLLHYSNMKSELHEKQQLISKLQAESHKMFMNNNWQISELEKLQIDNKKLNKLKQLIDKFEQENQRHQREKADLSKNVVELQKRIENLNKEQMLSKCNVASLEQKNKKLTEECQREQYFYNLKVNQLNNEIETLNTEVGHLEELLSKFKLEKDTLKQDKIAISKSLNGLKKTIDTLNDEREIFNSNIIFLNEQLQRLNEESQKERESYNSKIIQLNDEVQALNCKISNLTNDLEMKDNQIANLNSSLKNVQLKQSTESNLVSDNTFVTVLLNISMLLKSVEDNKNVLDVEQFLCQKGCQQILGSCEPLQCILKSIKSIWESKETLTAKYQKYENLISNVIQKLLLESKEMEEKYKHLQEKQSSAENKFRLVTENYNKVKDIVKKHISVEGKEVSQKTIQDRENLTILLKAKDMELKEKQKRYEANNRTLLKKVKEHMRGRRAAEKRSSYLEELHNSAFEELNTLKLKNSAMEYELQDLRNKCENYRDFNEKLKQKVVDLQIELNKSVKSCDKCLELEELVRQQQHQLESTKIILEEKEKQRELNNDLELKLQKLTYANEKIEREYENLKAKYENMCTELSEKSKNLTLLEDSLLTSKNMSSELSEKLLEKQNEHLESEKQRENMLHELQHQRDENKILSDEIVMLKYKLNHFEEKLSELQAQKQICDINWNKKESELQNLNNSLQNELLSLRNDLTSARNEGTFLQKLCTDLRVALDATLQQNKVMKEQLSEITQNHRKNSLPDLMSNLPLTNKWNENHINELLRQNNTPMYNPFPDLHNSLVSLRDEVVALRKQIFEKNSTKQQ